MKTFNNERAIYLIIILCLCAGLYIAPRRSLDYTLCKVNNYDETEDNVYADGVFVFNKYKTAHKYGTMMLEVPNELESILTIWINNCPETDLLLFEVVIIADLSIQQ